MTTDPNLRDLDAASYELTREQAAKAGVSSRIFIEGGSALQDRDRERLRDAEVIARCFHEMYESLAPNHGYRTRSASAVQWADVPAQNKALMVDTAWHLLAAGVIRPSEVPRPESTEETDEGPSCNVCAAREQEEREEIAFRSWMYDS